MAFEIRSSHAARVNTPGTVAVVLGSLTTVPALDRPDLIAAPVAAALAALPREQVLVAGIDPDLADTAAMSEAYDIALTASGNCVVVSGARAGDERIAACVVRADTRADVNTLVRRMLDVRKASFLPMERAVVETGMEHGGMMSEADMQALMDATGTEAARMYLEGMIEHHRGAIDAADTEIADGEYPPAVELARKIAQDQAAEITKMEGLLASL